MIECILFIFAILGAMSIVAYCIGAVIGFLKGLR